MRNLKRTGQRPWQRETTAGLTWWCMVGLSACEARTVPRQPDEPIVVQNAWMRAVDSGSVGGVYLILTNTDTAATYIADITTPFAVRATLHETVQENGMVHMVARTDYLVAPGATVQLAPGQLHIMLDPMLRSITDGDTLTLQITFANGTHRPVHVPVMSAAPKR